MGRSILICSAEASIILQASIVRLPEDEEAVRAAGPPERWTMPLRASNGSPCSFTKETKDQTYIYN